MPELSSDAPLSRSASDAESISIRQYIDLRIVEMATDMHARREGMAAELLTHRAQLAAEELTYRTQRAAEEATYRAETAKALDERMAQNARDRDGAMYVWRTAQEAAQKDRDRLAADIVTLRTEMDRALRDALAAHSNEHARAREADLLADKKLDTRLEDMNGLRTAITSAQQTAVSRDQLDDKVAAVAARIDSMSAGLAGQFTRLDVAISDLQQSRAAQQGRATALATMIGIGTFIVSVTVAVALHYVK